MKKVFLLAISVAFTFAACKDTKAEANSDATATETNVDHEDHTGHDHGTEAPATSEAASGQTASTPASTNAQEVKLNPPHGQPGHRCEIAVGAPLDGSAAPVQPTQAQPQAQPASGKGFLGGGNSQAQQATPVAQQAPVKQAPPAQQTAPGMQGKPNPAHGQPGHRCDIQVGQPLP